MGNDGSQEGNALASGWPHLKTITIKEGNLWVEH